jgi:hypothetical protein
MTSRPKMIRSLISKVFESLLAKIAVTLILAAIPLEILTGYVTQYVWHPIVALSQWILILLQTEVKAWHLILTILAFFLITRFVFRKLRQPRPIVPKEPNYYFIIRGGCKWKVNRYTGGVSITPYCVDHQVELSEYYFRCPICGDKNSGQLNPYEANRIRDEVSRIAAAQVAGHFKS